MKILIVVAMIIVFISAFFILFTADGMLKSNTTCIGETCSQPFYTTLFGISTVISFLLISLLAVYIVIKTLSSADIGESKTL